jgi:hypothetical protein
MAPSEPALGRTIICLQLFVILPLGVQRLFHYYLGTKQHDKVHRHLKTADLWDGHIEIADFETLEEYVAKGIRLSRQTIHSARQL